MTKKKLAIFFLILLGCQLFLFNSQFLPNVYAATTITTTFNCLAYDGNLQKNLTGASTLWNQVQKNATAGTNTNTSTTLTVSSKYALASYYCMRGFLCFNTGTTLARNAATITSAKLTLNASAAASSTQNLTIQNGQPTYPSTPLSTSDYLRTHWSGNGGSVNQTWDANIKYDITLTSTGLTWINTTVTGVTKLCLREGRDVKNDTKNITVPSTNIQMTFYTNESGTKGTPILSVTYTQTKSNILWPYYWDKTDSTGILTSGSYPYIDNSTSHYIEKYPAGIKNASWWFFQNTTFTAVPQRVYLYIEWNTLNAAFKNPMRIFLSDGTTESSLGYLNGTTETQQTSINVTSVLSTIAKVQSARIKFQFLNTASTANTRIYRVWLQLFNGPKPTVTGPTYAVGGSSTVFYAQWYDPDGYSKATFGSNSTGSWVNSSVSFSGQWTNTTLTIPSKQSAIIMYQFWCNDTSNNLETTYQQTASIVDNNFNSANFGTVGSTTASAPLSHTHMRWDFYINSTNLWFSTYFNGSYYVYASSTNGKTWFMHGAIRWNYGLSTQSGYYTSWIEERGGTVYFHYIYCNESASNGDLCYRRGIVNSTGYISWSTSEQVVVAHNSIPAGYTRQTVGNINTDPDGHVFIDYTFYNSTNCWIDVSCCDYTNGTWHTKAGYPLTIETDGYGLTPEDSVVTLGVDYKAIIVYCKTGQCIQSCTIANTTLGAVANASAYTLVEARHFSFVSDNHGNAHLAFIDNTASNNVRYCMWNGTSASWSIKDTILSTLTTFTSLVSYPQIGFDQQRNNVYVSWCYRSSYPITYNPDAVWMISRYLYSTSWQNLTRLFTVPNGYGLTSEPNVIIPCSKANCGLIIFSAQNVNTDAYNLQSYIFQICTSARVITVPDDYPTIQSAIDYASAGDTISVRNGTYYEHVIVNKTVSLIGECRNNTIVASSEGAVFEIRASNVTIDNFTIVGAPAGSYSVLVYGRYSSIYNNVISCWNGGVGVYVRLGGNDVIKGNMFNGTGQWRGMELTEARYCNVSGNIMSGGYDGIFIDTGGGELENMENRVCNNTISHMLDIGIYLETPKNFVSGNLISHCTYAISLNHCIGPSNTSIVCNTFSSNHYGIWANTVSHYIFYHNNFLNNTFGFFDYSWMLPVSSSNCSFDDGYPSGGNYWSNYNGTDFQCGTYQNVTGSDGIGDSGFVIGANDTDNFPLMTPWAPLTLNITASRTIVGQGYGVLLNFAIVNPSSFGENLNVTFFSNKTVIGRETNTYISAGNILSFTQVWNTSSFAYGNCTVSVIVSFVSNQIHAQFFTVSIKGVFITIPGDTNGDHKVNVLDLILIATHLGNSNGGGYPIYSPQWYQSMNCDLNNDGKVNVLDLIICATHLGQHW